MAIYHCSVKPVKRSAGRSATAAAAYRSGDRIVDQRTGEIHDYTRRSGVESTELVFPEHVTNRLDREKLWNTAETAETRKNSLVAREVEIALPDELTAEQRRELAGDFARRLAAQYRVAADVCIHKPGKEGDQRNHHAHILLTTREMTEDGQLGAKTRILDDRKTGPAEIQKIREMWAQVCNAALEQAGRTERIDHRSLREQGEERQATKHQGPTVTAMERDGIRTERGDINRAIQKRRQQLHEIEAELEMLKQAEAEDFERQRQAEETQKHTASRRPPATAEAKPAPQKKTSWLGLVGSLVPKRRKPNKAPEPAQQPPDQQAPPPPSPSASRRSPAPSRPFLFTTPERTEPQPQEQPPAIGLFASSPGELSEPSRAEVNEPAQQPTELSVQSQQAPHAPAQQSDLLHQLYNNEEWCKEIERILKKGEISNEDELKKLEYVFEDISHAIDYPDSYSDNEFDKKELEKTQKKIYSMMQQYKGQITTEYQEYQREEQSQVNTNLYGLNIEVYGLKTDAEQEQQRSQKGRDKQ